MLDQQLIDQFVLVVGAKYVLQSPDQQAPYLTEWRDKYQGATKLVLLPGSVDEVAAIVRLANQTATPLVPQGGNTGLVGGQLPDLSGEQVVVSLKRLNKKRSISPVSQSMIVEAGVTLFEAQDYAQEHERLFPLSLASEGSCQIGGNLSTNAGGIQVLKYGMMRDLVLGLEVVLPSGEIWRGLSDLRKDNTGYDLKALFLGAEGTLGIITAACLKLFPLPVERQVAFVACRSLEQMANLFERVSEQAGACLCAFEMLSHRGLDFSLQFLSAQGQAGEPPLKTIWPWYGVIELESTQQGVVEPLLETVLEKALSQQLIEEAVLSSSQAQRQSLWAFREVMSEAQKPQGGSIKHDVSVPVAQIPAFIQQADAVVEKMIPGARPVPFGHFGDGNIHYNVSQPEGADKNDFLSKWEALNEAVYEVVLDFNGSISAEHGIGVMKRDLLARVKDPVALDLMKTVKKALDPNKIMNPGKVL